MKNFAWAKAQTVMDAAAAASVTVADAMLSPPNTTGVRPGKGTYRDIGFSITH